MVKKDKLASSIRIRGMLKGPKGVGKTSSLVATAANRARRGKRVLFMEFGTEAGAVLELHKLPQEVLDFIDHSQPRSIKDALVLLPKPNEPGYDLVIVDALQNLRTISGQVAVKSIITAGLDKDEDDKKEEKTSGQSKRSALQRILDEHGVVMPEMVPWGKGTGQQKGLEADFFDNLWDQRCDILIGFNTKTLAGSSNNYVDVLGAFFEVILDLEKVRVTKDDVYEHRYTIEKLRGVKHTSAKSIPFDYAQDLMPTIQELMMPPKPKPTLRMHCEQENLDFDVPSEQATKCAQAAHTLGAAMMKPAVVA